MVFLSNLLPLVAAVSSLFMFLYAALYALVALRSFRYSSTKIFCLFVNVFHLIPQKLKKTAFKLSSDSQAYGS
nr:MAG TPA: hypothetical protein [Caudoviricetes sp.]